MNAACGRFDDDLAAWRAGALPEDLRRAHEAHVAGCLACQRLLAADEALDAALPLDLPHLVDDRLAGAIERLGASPTVDRRVPWAWVVGLSLAAAAAALADRRPEPAPAPPREPWRYQGAPLAPDERPQETHVDPRPLPENL